MASIQLSAQSCSAPAAVNKADLMGQWKGSFTYDNEILPLKVQLRNGAEQMEARTAIAALDVPNSTLDAWLCKSNELHMRVDLPDQRVLKLIGTPDDGKMVGRLVYYGRDGAVAAREVFTMALVK